MSEPSEHRAAPAVSRRDVLRLFGVGAAAAVVSSAVVACSSSASTAQRADRSPGDPDAVDVTSFGAKGDGRTDDHAAIQRALDKLRPQQTLQFPAGKVFCHSKVLTVHTAGVRLIGPGTLRATAEAHSALRIAAADVTVQGLTVAMAKTTKRWSTPDQHKLFIDGVDGVVVRDVVIDGSAAAGLFCLGSSNFTLERVHVNDTRADGIHMTYGAHHGTVTSPVITRSGDDGVAVVSYLQDGVVCHDIEITDPQVNATTGGRGISVVGGHDVTYRDISITSSSAASVYLACEGSPSNSCPTERVTVAGGTISRANTDADIDHGAVLIYSGRKGGTVDTVTVSGLTIAGTRPGASRQIGVVADGSGDGVENVVFSELKLASSPTPYQGNAPAGSFSLDNVAADGHAVRVPA